MSELKVEVTKIDEVMPHPNADRLEIAKIAGWNCVVRKGELAPGQKVVYIPIDAVLGPELEGKLFPPDSKVKLSKSRVKTIKLRGAISQGIVVTIPELVTFGYEGMPLMQPGDDVADYLGITKYEPPASSTPGQLRGNMISPKKGNSAFRKYTDIENFKHYPTLFEPGEMVVVTEKMHGTSARYGYLKAEANTLWKKVKKFFGMLDEYEFVLGSRNVQLQDKLRYDGFYQENVYGKIAEQLQIPGKLPKNTALFGEIVGDGIQGGYTYGCGPKEHKFFAYDVMVDGRYLDYVEFYEFCVKHDIPMVPQLYIGAFDQAILDKLRCGDSTVGGQKCREGVVIKPLTEQTTYMGRKVLKYINDEYLLEDQTEFH